LGIIVSDNEIGKKIGDQIMDDLISNSKNDIYLSVDINNNLAVYLYEKKGFEILEKKINYYLMKLIK
jgi:ribosomal protein S18 acetylase RimI-like enzyme